VPKSPREEPTRPGPAVGVIPARWASTRFPGKPLCDIAGKSLVRRVWERCRQCRRLDRILLATDDERIAEAGREFGAEVVLTRPAHPSGTDRVAEAAAASPEAGIVVNIQGDEPLISPALIDGLVDVLRHQPEVDMVTAATPVADAVVLEDANVVKVVTNRQGRALYFSRSRIPFPRREDVPGLTWLRHKGIYGYRSTFLERFVGWPPGVLEQAEGLEQLRALENGASIHVVRTDDDSPGVDTPEQARIVSAQIASG